jgi:hypothetical protein
MNKNISSVFDQEGKLNDFLPSVSVMSKKIESSSRSFVKKITIFFY